MKASALAASALFVTTHVATAACFGTQWPVRFVYSQPETVTAPVSGVVRIAPKLGYTYSRVEFGSGVPDFPSDQHDRIVATIVSPLDSIAHEITNVGDNHVFRSEPRQSFMLTWQNKTRADEDFLFSLQQGQTAPVPLTSEPVNAVASRVTGWAKPETYTYGDPTDYVRKRSVDVRFAYSDYMRAYEEPQIMDSLQTSLVLAHLKDRLADADLAQGYVLCPEQCQVNSSYVLTGQYVRAGDPIASVVYPYKKLFTLTFPATHIFTNLDPSSVGFSVRVVNQTPAVQIRDLIHIPEKDNTPLPVFDSHILGNLRLSDDGKFVSATFNILDDNGDSEKLLSVLSNNTLITIQPTQYNNASDEDKQTMEQGIKSHGYTCE